MLKEVLFVGHILSNDGMAVDPAKVVAVIEQKQSKNITEVLSCLGLVGYYSRII